MTYFQDSSKNTKYLYPKLYLILVIISLIGFIVVKYYLMPLGQPASFKKGLELVLNNEVVVSKIGSYASYTFNKNQLPKDTDNPAFFKIAITGDLDKTIFLTCEMQKENTGNWLLKKIKIDSLKSIH
jgi:hypothetical protein